MKFLALIFLLLATLAMHAADGPLGTQNGTTINGPVTSGGGYIAQNSGTGTNNIIYGLGIEGTGAGSFSMFSLWNHTAFATDVGTRMNFFGGSGGNTLGSIISAYSSNSTDNAYLAFLTRASGGALERMRLTGDGWLGLGIAHPSAMFDIEAGNGSFVFSDGTVTNVPGFVQIINAPTNVTAWGTARAGMLVMSRTSWAQGAGNGISLGGLYDDNRLTNEYGAEFGIISGIKEDAVAGHNNGAITFHTRAAGQNMGERVRISGSGNLGVGTANPLSLLTLGGTPTISTDTSDGSDTKELAIAGGGTDSVNRGAIVYLAGNENGDTGKATVYGGNVNGADISFIVAPYGAAQTVILKWSTGKVGIGTVTPQAVFDVVGDIRASTTVAATNGFVSMKSNKSVVTTISVGASPFSYTNTSGVNGTVIIDGSVAFSATWLDTTVQTSLAGGITIPLQNGEWTTVTYSVAPGMFFKPF